MYSLGFGNIFTLQVRSIRCPDIFDISAAGEIWIKPNAEIKDYFCCELLYCQVH
jgi:hypothetical protein